MNEHPFLFIHAGNKYVRLDIDRIHYIEALRNYSQVATADKNFTVLTTLKEWMTVLPQDFFCQIHRSFIIAIPKIEAFDSKKVYMLQRHIPIGEQYKISLTKKITLVGGSEASRRSRLQDSPSRSLAAV